MEVSFNNIKRIGFYCLIKLRFCLGQNAGYFNKANQRYILFLFSFPKSCLKNRWTHNVKLFIVIKQMPWIWFFFNSKNSHVHRPSKLVENLQHLHITTEKNLTSNHCLKLKGLGFSVLKYIVLTFCWHSIEALAAFAF